MPYADPAKQKAFQKDYQKGYDRNQPRRKHPGGRPRLDGKDENEVLSKLEYVWAMRGTDKQACAFADISESTLARWYQQNPKVLARKERLREMPVLRALKTVRDNLADPAHAEWFLERVMPQEFSKKADGALPPGPTINVFGNVNLQQVVTRYEEEFKKVLMDNLNPDYETTTVRQTDLQPVAPAGVLQPAGEVPEGAEPASGEAAPGSGADDRLPGPSEGERLDEEEDGTSEVIEDFGEMEAGESVRHSADT